MNSFGKVGYDLSGNGRMEPEQRRTAKVASFRSLLHLLNQAMRLHEKIARE